MKYMVMECHPSYAVVLDEEGRFLKVANMRYQVGQTVTEIIEMHIPPTVTQPVSKPKRRWVANLAAVAACLVLVLTGFFRLDQMAYASVYLTINPEVRIDVNRRDVVVGVAGMNTDGEDLLEGYEFDHKNLDLVMDELVDRAIDMGYLHEGGKVTLSLDADEEWIVSHSDAISTHLNDYLTEKITVTIDIENQPVETVPAESFVIPVGSENYGESDYVSDDADDWDDEDYDDDSDDAQYDDSEDDDGQTDYGSASDDDGDSSYDDAEPYEANDDEDSDDDPDDREDSDEDDSAYDDSDDDSEDDDD